MGLLDRMIRNVANDVLGDAVRQVERNASQAISGKVSSVVNDYTEAAKTKVEDKKVELRDKIIEEADKQKLPDIVPNSEGSEILKFGSKTKVKYHYIDEEKGINTFVDMIAIGAMTYQTELSGKYEGNDDVAYMLSDAVFAGLQVALDEVSQKHTAPEEVFSKHAISISQKANTEIEAICNEFKIPKRTLVFSVIHPGNGYVAGASDKQTTGPSWTCPYCGSVASGNACSSCGAPKTE